MLKKKRKEKKSQKLRSKIGWLSDNNLHPQTCIELREADTLK